MWQRVLKAEAYQRFERMYCLQIISEANKKLADDVLFILKMEVVTSSEMSELLTTRPEIPEDSNLYFHHSVNPKSNYRLCLFLRTRFECKVRYTVCLAFDYCLS
jgi:hypothetical protein